MDYDPRDHGALCDRCSLNGSFPVPPLHHRNPLLLIVGDAPSGHAEALEIPFVGASGKELDKALELAGVKREQCSFTNTMLCRPPGNNLKLHLAKVRKGNKTRVAKGEEPKLLPVAACHPRLMAELERAPALLLVGAFARAAVFGGSGDEKKLDAARGFPDEVEIAGRNVPVLPSYHPEFVLRSRKYTSIFRGDVAKSVRMATGTLQPNTPRLFYDLTPEQLSNFLEALEGPASYDVETSMHGGWNGGKRLFCVGIGNDHEVTCVQWNSVESPARELYTPAEREQVVQIVNTFFANEQKAIWAHNMMFDHQVMESQWPGWRMGRKEGDTIMLHHLAWSELPHDLDFLTAQFTDNPRHKGVDHTRWASDYKLHKYCMIDVAITSVVAKELTADPRVVAQKRAFKNDLFISRFCRGMHKVGVKIDTVERDVQYRDFSRKMERLLQDIQERIGKEKGVSRKFADSFNPRSGQDMRRLLFDVWGMDPVPEKAGGMTDTGEYAVGKEQLFYLIDQDIPTELSDLLLTIIDYNEASKLRGTYCRVEPAPDGRVHAGWKGHVVVSGRLACSDPNLMNIPWVLKVMYVPESGHVFIACDKSQLEARVCAWLAQDTWQIDAFLAGADMHRLTACAIFDEPDPEKISDKERKFAKTFKFACQYLAGVNKVRQMVRNFRDTDGSRPFRRYTKREARSNFTSFWETHAKIMAFHMANREVHKQRGYLESVKHQRQRWFLDGSAEESKEELANYIIQSTSADDVNEATERVVAEFPWGFAGPNTGVVIQCHDALVLEVPADRAIEIGGRVVDIMYSKLGDMPLPVDLAIGRNYRDLKEYVKGPDGVWAPKEKK